MNKSPLVYLIILNYNSFEETIKCIASAKSIEYNNYKIIVVDNHSTDNSKEILEKKTDDYIFIASDCNLGYAKGNNIGIEYALNEGAEYICILNNDVEVERDFLKSIIDYMDNNLKVGIAGPCICNFEDRDKIQSMGANINLYTGLALAKKKNQSYSSLTEKLIKVDYLGGACFVARRDVFKSVGVIPEMYFLFFEETEFCLNAKRAGFELVCLKNSRVYHKQSATISKYKGLSYYFLNRNRIIFMRRNSNILQRLIFSLYLIIESLGRIILKKEPISLFKLYYDGIKANINSIDMEKVKYFVGGR